MQRRPEQISPIESQLAYWLNYVGYRITTSFATGRWSSV